MAIHTLFELGRMGNRWIHQCSMTLVGVSVTGGDDHVRSGDKDVLESGGGWSTSAPDAQLMRYTGADEEEDEDESYRNQIWIASRVWLIDRDIGRDIGQCLRWMSNMSKEQDTGREIAPGRGLVIKLHNVVLAIRWPIK
ncbi:hypothetical protein F5888DRAFT_1903610 [Russula emetica]|nr:hypothetical protein F5888DRAFT_1903610 [Russula emetica]